MYIYIKYISSHCIMSASPICDSLRCKMLMNFPCMDTAATVQMPGWMFFIFLIKLHSIFHNSMSAENREFGRQCLKGYCFRVNKKLPIMTIFLSLCNCSPQAVIQFWLFFEVFLAASFTTIRDLEASEWVFLFAFRKAMAVVAGFPLQ